MGEVCTELRRAESERILRAQPFLAFVRVTVYDDHAGGVRVDVLTGDEISLFGGLSLQAAVPHVLGAALGESNLAGQGLGVGGAWRNGIGLRDAWAAQIIDHQIDGRPDVLTLVGARLMLGGYWEVRVVHPFFTDLQKYAWLVDFGQVRSYVKFPSDQLAEPANLDYRLNYAQMGVLTRLLGGPGHLTLLGLSLSAEHAAPAHSPSFCRTAVASSRTVIPLWSRAISLSMPFASMRCSGSAPYHIFGYRDSTRWPANRTWRAASRWED